MKRIVVVLAMLSGLATVNATDAGAVVCARGVLRAGCVGPNGAVGVRPGVAPVAYRGAVVRRPVLRRY